MFQSFKATSNPEQGPPRLQALRTLMRTDGLDGYLIPRADVHQGEYVAACDDRLAWLTGFTGSAGFCAALHNVAGVFVDGRYRTQAREQVDLQHFTPVDWPEMKLASWLRAHLPDGGTVGYNGWLHTAEEIEKLTRDLADHRVTLVARTDAIDAIWKDQPATPVGVVRIYPDDLAGESHASKRAHLAQDLRDAGQSAAIITLPDSVAWLLNIRGTDIPRNPVAHAFAILHDDATVALFIDARKLSDEVLSHLGKEVTLRPYEAFGEAVSALSGLIRVDKTSAPIKVSDLLQEANTPFEWGQDPCVLPKACKTSAEIAATREAHLRDGAAMCEFLTWFAQQTPGSITEIDVITKLESCRAATGALLDISFDTIAGSGPNGALPHYRVTEASNRTLQEGDLLVLDSGGQYQNGTTDITRTLPVGSPGDEERAAYTRVLQGMIAMSRVRFPKGLAGRDLDAIARYPLWLAGQDYNHGTGHGVGVALCVHEGPQRLSRASHVPFEPGMIISNEPGYYREGAFGIRIENLVVVQKAQALKGADPSDMVAFETITWVPIDTSLIVSDMLSNPEREWLNTYHATCRAVLAHRLSPEAQDWLSQATAEI